MFSAGIANPIGFLAALDLVVLVLADRLLLDGSLEGVVLLCAVAKLASQLFSTRDTAGTVGLALPAVGASSCE
jgi:hypothetical protein